MRITLSYEWGQLLIQVDDWLEWLLHVTPLDCVNEYGEVDGGSLFGNLEKTTEITVECRGKIADHVSVYHTAEWALLELCDFLAHSCVWETNNK